MRTISKRRFFEMCGYIPHKGQEQIHAAVDSKNISVVVAACGARFGKTMAAAHEMAFQALIPRKDFMGWCVAPTHALADLVFDTTAQILQTFLKGNVSVDKNEGLITFTNLGGGRSRIMRRSTDRAQDTAKLVGYAVDFMVLDEASAIAPDSIWENQLRTRLIDRAGHCLMISTPRGTQGFFAKLWRRSKRDDKTVIGIRLPSWTNPHGHVRASLLKERKTMPKRAFLQEYAARFISGEGLVFDPEDVKAIAIGEFEGFDPRYEYFGGLDLGMTNDPTVLTIIRAPRPDVANDRAKVVYMQRFSHMPVESQLMLVKEITDRYGECQLYVDETGMGKPILEQASNLGIFVRGVYWTQQEKSALVKNAMVLIEKHAIILPMADLAPTFHDELSTYAWEKTESRLFTTSNAPKGGTDDCIASFIMACKWIRAAGTAGRDRAMVRGAPLPTAQPRAKGIPQIIVKGEADPNNVPRTMTTRSGRGSLWTNSLFGGSL